MPAAVLVAAVVATYAGVWQGEFLWDDDLHISANPTIVGPLGLKEIWTTARANYFPLVLTNFWVQHALWGLNPLGYHVVTLACHALAALLLWCVLRRLRGPGAWLGAALWALHPVQVESVAWICELKNTQSAVFFLAAIWCYLKWLETDGADSRDGGTRPTTRSEAAPPTKGLKTKGAGVPAENLTRSQPRRVFKEHDVGLRPGICGGYYSLALGAAVLALLSKPSTVMLPVALALCVWWMRRRVAARDLLRLAPFFALSALVAGWTIWEQKYHSGASGAAWSQTLGERFVIAGRVIWFYLGKLAWPEPLVFIYPRWQVTAGSVVSFVPLVAAVAGLGWLWRGRARGPAWAASLLAAAYFVALLFPVLGFFSVYFFRYSFVGDHFQYLASMGPLALAGAGLARVFSRSGSPVSVAPAVAGGRAVWWWVGGLTVVGLAALSHRETRQYANRETLWRTTVARNPDAIMAWLNLGDTLVKQGRYEEAIAIFQRALRVQPDGADTYNDMGGAYLALGKPEEARAALERAVALAPRRAEVHNNLGAAQRSLGDGAAAIRSFQRALELDADYPEAHDNLGAELAEAGQTEEAIRHFATALRLAPRNASALNNLGHALRSTGKLEESIQRHRQALEIRPNFPDALAGLGYALVLAGRAGEGLPLLERARQASPDHAGIRGCYGRALAVSGRTDEALPHFSRAVELAPHSAEAHTNLGTALAQLGRGPEALAKFERATQLAPRLAAARLNLGNALFAATRWAAAAEQFEAVVQLRPEDASLHVRLAVARVNGGRIEDAVAPFEAALRFNPEAAEVHDQFAQVLRALGRNREALEHFERAAELRRIRR